MVSFASLKRGSDFDKFKKQAAAESQPAGAKDDPRFWNPTTDKAGNGMAVIRFLDAPAVDGEDGIPWVRVFKHGFQGPGGWLIDECLTTLGKDCPVCEYNSELWNSGVESNKDVARKQKRKLTYVANILVVSDTSCPENNGQLKLFRFGKKIFDKIEEAMTPAFPDEKPINPFDFWSGANFKLKMRNVEGYRNYDKSEFETPSPVYDDDDKMEALWKTEYSLKEFIDPSQFKTYEQIKNRLDKVLGTTSSNKKAEDTPVSKFNDPSGSPKNNDPEDGPDDDIDYFKSMANSDDVPF